MTADLRGNAEPQRSQNVLRSPARATQELAGHQDLTTTQRYMHLSPAAVKSAIQLLDAPGGSVGAWQHDGNEIA